PADHHPVPAANAAASPGGALGQARRVRGPARGGDRTRVRGRDVRAAGAVLLPGRTAVRPGHRAAGRFRPGTVTVRGPGPAEASAAPEYRTGAEHRNREPGLYGSGRVRGSAELPKPGG